MAPFDPVSPVPAPADGGHPDPAPGPAPTSNTMFDSMPPDPFLTDDNASASVMSDQVSATHATDTHTQTQTSVCPQGPLGTVDCGALAPSAREPAPPPQPILPAPLLTSASMDLSPFVADPDQLDSPELAATPKAPVQLARYIPSARYPARRHTASTASSGHLAQPFPVRPPVGRTRSLQDRSQEDVLAGMGSIRMGASALISALQAVPWDDDPGDSSADDNTTATPYRSSGSVAAGPKPRREPSPVLPGSVLNKFSASRMNSSLRMIPAMSSEGSDSGNHPRGSSGPKEKRHHGFHRRSPSPEHLEFPFKENTIARRARPPGSAEISYQHAEPVPVAASPPDSRLHRRASQATITAVRDIDSATIRCPTPQGPGTLAGSVRPVAPVASTDAYDQVRESTPVARMSSSSRAEALDSTPDPRTSEDLARRLQEVFGLDNREEVIAEMPCWLMRSLLLKGYLFVTRRNVCFYAHMPEAEASAIKSGPLYKKSSKTHLSSKFWVILRDNVLSWYDSAKDPYFPRGTVSLHYATGCELVDDTRFKLRTAERNYTFAAETAGNAEEWVRTIDKAMFKSRHEGENVKIIIPVEAIVEVERNPTLEFAETIEVVDPEDAISIESYFFASFPDNDFAYDTLRGIVANRSSSALPQLPQQHDSPSSIHTPAKPDSSGPARQPSVASRIGSALRPFIHGEHSDAGIRVPIAAPSKSALPEVYTDDAYLAESELSEMSGGEEPRGYPPKLKGRPPQSMEQQPASWTGAWIKHPAKLFGTSPASDQGRLPVRKPSRKPRVTEVVSHHSQSPSSDEDSEYYASSTLGASASRRKGHRSRLSVDSNLSTISGNRVSVSFSDASKRSQSSSFDTSGTSRKFYKLFALPEREVLIDHVSGYLYRGLPIRGRFYVSTSYLCFMSSNLLSKTKMILPLQDVFGTKQQKSYRFGYSGLIVVVKGHEELFLEYSSIRKRDEIMDLIEEQIDQLREKPTAAAIEEPSDVLMFDGPDAGSIPSPMFNSTTSTLLDFKPDPMTVICLTIGSRGDVQPYIALCKGLQAEGHKTVIATHGEYQDWVEGHGIGFRSVGGDPAELMAMCVDNGMFTVAFLKEGLQRFRGWLDDLLASSWEACQGADLLIESPSAMGGIHIAEALRIPYYRAFTMPWTRTRAYPQAFAVPERSRGGSYNYMTYVMFDQVFWRAISGQINRWRRNMLGIESTSLDKLEQWKAPFLYNFSPTVVPPPLDWTEWIHVTGYWFLDQADGTTTKKWTPPEDLVRFIDEAHAQGKKVVYIGFGSIVVSDPQEMTRCVVEAVGDAGVCAILSKGWSDRGSRGKSDPQPKDAGNKEGADGIAYPPEIYAIDSIDHAWLFPRIEAACHHGGAGTTGASLRAGIPTIIKPFFGDQAFWAERVESLGVGAGIHKLTREALAAALVDATTNDRQIAKAKAIGEAIRKENGVARAIEAIYRDLDYAKAIIKPPSDPSGRVRKLSLRSNKSSGSPSRHSSAGPGSRRGGSHSRSLSLGASDCGHYSDGSWSVVSGSGRPSPQHRSLVVTDGEHTDDDSDSGRRLSLASGLGSIVGHLLPQKLAHELSKSERAP